MCWKVMNVVGKNKARNGLRACGRGGGQPFEQCLEEAGGITQSQHSEECGQSLVTGLSAHAAASKPARPSPALRLALLPATLFSLLYTFFQNLMHKISSSVSPFLTGLASSPVGPDSSGTRGGHTGKSVRLTCVCFQLIYMPPSWLPPWYRI